MTALKASGMSARRVCLPILFLTLVLCGMLHPHPGPDRPRYEPAGDVHQDQIQGRSPRTYGWSPGGRWTFGADGRLYHYRLFDPQQVRFQGLSVFHVDLAAARILEQWFCSSAHWNGTAGSPRRGGIERFRSLEPRATTGDSTTRRSPSSMRRTTSRAESGPSSRGTRSTSKPPSQTSNDEIEGLAKSGYDTTRLRVKYWQKTAIDRDAAGDRAPRSPLRFQGGGRGSMYGVGVGLILAIVFWATAAIFNALGLETILPPLLAAWSPNVFYAVVGIYFLLFVPT